MRTIFDIKLLAPCLLLFVHAARAQSTYTWTDVASGTGGWSDLTNWDVLPIEANDNTIRFFSGTTGAANTVTASFTTALDAIITAGGTNATSFDLESLILNGTSTGTQQTITISPSGTARPFNFIGDANAITGNAPIGTAGLKYAIQNNIAIGGTGGLALGGNGNTALNEIVLSGSISGTGGLVKNGSSRFDLTGNKSFSGGLTMNAGYLYVGGATNTYTGGVTVNGGRLIFTTTSALGNNQLTLNNGAIFTYALASAGGTPTSLSNNLVIGGNSVTLVDSTNIQGNHPLTMSGTVDLGGADRTLVIDTGTGQNSATFSGVVSNGGIIKSGPGVLMLSHGANTYAGDTVVRRGTLRVNNNAPSGAVGALGNSATAVQLGDSLSTSAFTIRLQTASGFTMARDISVNAFNDTGETSIGNSGASGTATFSGAITLNKGVLLQSNAGSTAVFNGLIDDGAGSFAVTSGSASPGTGVVNLNRPAGNTYNGGTNVAFGTLLVNNTSGSGTGTGAVTVAAGATLGGSGIIAGATTISGIHSPGNSPGIQTFGSDLGYTTGAAVVYELIENTTAQESPEVFDQIVVGEDLDFAGATTLNLGFNTSGSTVDWSDSLWSTNQSWQLYDVAGATSNFGNLSLASTDWLDGQGDSFSSVQSGSSFSLSLSGNDIYLNFTPVPEPSSITLLMLGSLGLWMVRRKNSRPF